MHSAVELDETDLHWADIARLQLAVIDKHPKFTKSPKARRNKKNRGIPGFYQAVTYKVPFTASRSLTYQKYRHILIGQQQGFYVQNVLRE